MRRFRTAKTEVRQAVVSLLLLPFLFAALLPQGYMPSVAEDGTFTVTLCTTDGLRTVTLDADGNEVPAGTGEDDAHFGHCIFASVATFALLHQAADLPDAGSDRAPLFARQIPGLRLKAYSNLPGARAPPVLL